MFKATYVPNNVDRVKFTGHHAKMARTKQFILGISFVLTVTHYTPYWHDVWPPISK